MFPFVLCLVKDKIPPILHESPSDVSGKEGSDRTGVCRDMSLAFVGMQLRIFQPQVWYLKNEGVVPRS